MLAKTRKYIDRSCDRARELGRGRGKAREAEAVTEEEAEE